jgi:predicted DNA-binding protein (MmcQ/YjbR family)
MNIEDLRQFCLSLPSATEDIKWSNDLCFSIGGKLFCVCDLTDVQAITLKVGEDEFHELCETESINPAKYTGRYGHITVSNFSRFSDDEWRERIKKSYELTLAKLPKKVRGNLC